jgi:hypothetical protein
MRRQLALALALSLLALCGCSIIKQASLEQAVAKALAADPRTKDYKFEVSLQQPGEVLITGEVGTKQDIDDVTAIAKAVPGVTKVDNRCKTEEPGSGMVQDMTVDGTGLGL